MPFFLIFAVTLMFTSVFILRGDTTDANQFGDFAFYAIIIAICIQILSLRQSRNIRSRSNSQNTA